MLTACRYLCVIPNKDIDVHAAYLHRRLHAMYMTFKHIAHEIAYFSIAGSSQEAGGQNKWCGEYLQTVNVIQMQMHNIARGCMCAPGVGRAVCPLARLRCQVELEQAVA